MFNMMRSSRKTLVSHFHVLDFWRFIFKTKVCMVHTEYVFIYRIILYHFQTFQSNSIRKTSSISAEPLLNPANNANWLFSFKLHPFHWYIYRCTLCELHESDRVALTGAHGTGKIHVELSMNESPNINIQSIPSSTQNMLAKTIRDSCMKILTVQKILSKIPSLYFTVTQNTLSFFP